MIASQIGIVQDYVFERETEIAHSMGFSYYSAYPYILMFGRNKVWLQADYGWK